MTTQMTTIADDALRLLISQYQGKENFENNIRAILAPIQTLQNDVWELKNGMRSLDTLSLYLLDIVGSWVGVLRQGKTDQEMLLAIKIQIAINTSSGTWDDIESGVNLITGSTFSMVTDLYNFAITIFCNADLSELESFPVYTFGYGSGFYGYGEGSYSTLADAEASVFIYVLKKLAMAGVRIAGLNYLSEAYAPFGYGGSGYGEGYYATGA